MGFTFLTAAILSNVISKFYSKSMVHKVPIYAGAVIMNTVGVTMSILIFFATGTYKDVHITFTSQVIWLIILGILLWTCFSLLNLISIKKTEVSLREPINQSRVILVGIFGALLLGEQLDLMSIVGILVIFLGLLICLFDVHKKFGSIKDPGVQIVFIGCVITAAIAIVDKMGLKQIPLLVYSMIMYGVPLLLILCALNKQRFAEIKHVVKTPALLKVSLFSGFLALTSILATWIAYQHLDLHIAFPLLQLANIITVIIAIIFLHERTNMHQKILGSIVTILGAILVKW